MDTKSAVRGILSAAMFLTVACGGGAGLGEQGQSVTQSSGSAQASLTISAQDWSTLQAQGPEAPPAGMPGCDGGPGGMGPGGAPPPGGQAPGQPPQAAIDACAGLTAEAACSLTLDGHAVTGKCLTPPNSSTLACVPPPPPPPQAAIDACANLTAGASCSATVDGHTLSGTCRNGPDGAGPLACAPQAPPQGAPSAPPADDQGGVAGMLSLDGAAAIAVRVHLLPARDGSSSTPLMIQVPAHDDGSASILVPQPPANSNLPPPPGNAQAVQVQLSVDHGSGATDFGTYLQLTPPAR